MDLKKISKYCIALMAVGMVLGTGIEMAMAEDVIVDMKGIRGRP